MQTNLLLLFFIYSLCFIRIGLWKNGWPSMNEQMTITFDGILHDLTCKKYPNRQSPGWSKGAFR